MTISEFLPESIDEDEIEPVESPGLLYKLEHERGKFGGELLLMRYLTPEDDPEELLDADVAELEARFYDNETPNQWNIRLIWAYEEGAEPDQGIREDLEDKTRFAIRRCVPAEDLADFVAPLQTSKAKLRSITDEFKRSELIESIFEEGLGFLFEDLTRDQKFERLVSGVTQEDASGLPSETQDEPLDKFVDTTHRGEFRPNAHKEELNAERFTLLYGRNGTGKTSLLDATAYGLVGQIRHDDGRADDYDGLGVTLEGDSEPLSTDPSDIHDRIANWYGFRPHGTQLKYLEFYRVNYQEAGAATRFIENDPSIKNNPDLDIDETLRRLLFGAELEDARKDKSKLLPRLENRIDENEEEIKDLRLQARELREQHRQAQEIFSRLRVATESLSPAASAIFQGGQKASEQESEQTSDPERLKKWATWEQRFADLAGGLDASPLEIDGTQPAGGLRNQLFEANDHLEEILDDLERVRDLQSERADLSEFRSQFEQADLTQISASVGLIAMVLGANGIDAADLGTIKRILETETDAELSPREENTIASWRETAIKEITSQLTELNKQKENIEQLDQLDKQRQELLNKIRKQTEEYISITDDVYHCPACYIEQDGEAILTRDKPEQFHGDESKSVPESLLNRISELETAKEILESPAWEDVDYDVTVRYEHLCGTTAFQQLWTTSQLDNKFELVFANATGEAVETVAHMLEENIPAEPDDVMLVKEINSRIKQIERLISELRVANPELSDREWNVPQLKDQYRSRREDIDAAVQVLGQLPETATHLPLDVQEDYRVIKRAHTEVKENPDAVRLPDDYENELEDIKEESENLQRENQNCRDSIERLEHAFEKDGGEAELDRLVEDHMMVISTLFKVFQRPYEFEAVRYEGNQVVVERRGEDSTISMANMSSGQRAALALAIFVTNNIAHERAPPLMMLDEPFAHLDDINALSFFNLLIELVRMGDRQIIFATANKEVAKLLERKIGDSPDFTKVELPPTNRGVGGR
jgi:exonuclease SbcC